MAVPIKLPYRTDHTYHRMMNNCVKQGPESRLPWERGTRNVSHIDENINVERRTIKLILRLIRLSHIRVIVFKYRACENDFDGDGVDDSDDVSLSAPSQQSVPMSLKCNHTIHSISDCSPIGLSRKQENL